jgi:hypothetical protein
LQMTLVKLMSQLPIELFAKIMYGSGVCSPEAQLIKDMIENLIIQYEQVEYMWPQKSFVNHLTEMCVLNKNYDFITYIFFIS